MREKSIFQLTMAERYGKTHAEDYYYTAPYKIGLPQTAGKGQRVVVMMASAGLLKGDQALCRIVCKDHTITEITDQSYTKVFDTGDGEAYRDIEITVGEHAVLDYAPCPVIPFKNSSFCGRIQVNLKENTTLYFSEIMTAGRIAMGEKFVFRRFENRVCINIEERPVYLELNRMIPAKQHLEDFFYFDGFTHQGTFYYYSPQIPSIQTLKEMTDHIIALYLEDNKMHGTEILYGITEARKGIVWKILSHQAQNIEDIFKEIRHMLQKH